MCIKKKKNLFIKLFLFLRYKVLKFIVDQIACCGKGEQNESTKLIIGTKPKRFDLVRLFLEQKQNVFNLFQNYLKLNQNVLAFFKVQKRNQNETELISYRIETFPYTYASKETKQNFCELFPNFSTSSEGFFCFKLLWNQNKTLQIAPGFSKDKTKRLDNLKKIWKRNKTKAFGQKFLRTDRKRFVSIQNFDLKTFTFDLFLEQKQQIGSFRS